MIYKQHRITRKTPPLKLPLTELQQLLELSKKLHEDCRTQFLVDLSQKNYQMPGVDSTNTTAVNKVVDDQKLLIHINGTEGEYLNFLGTDPIPNFEFPYHIQNIQIENLGMFQHTYKKLEPSIHFDIIIDFKHVKIFDLISLPSHSTPNASSYSVVGLNSTLVNGIGKSIEDFLKHHKSYRGLIHKENIYDILLWLIFLPLVIFYASKYQAHIPESVVALSTILQVIIAITSLFTIALCFRLLFNFGRWFFPYTELTTQTSLERKVLKAIYSLAVTALAGKIFVHIAVILWEKLTN